MAPKERRKRKIVLENVAGSSAAAIVKAAVKEGVAASMVAHPDRTYTVTLFNIQVSRALELIKRANDGDGPIPE